jgi:hypothetical protein
MRIPLERLLSDTSSIELDGTFHGPEAHRTFDHEPGSIACGLTALHLRLRPSAEFVP